MAVDTGFEPVGRFYTPGSLANCWLKPLTQSTIIRFLVKMAESVGIEPKGFYTLRRFSRPFAPMSAAIHYTCVVRPLIFSTVVSFLLLASGSVLIGLVVFVTAIKSSITDISPICADENITRTQRSSKSVKMNAAVLMAIASSASVISCNFNRAVIVLPNPLSTS